MRSPPRKAVWFTVLAALLLAVVLVGQVPVPPAPTDPGFLPTPRTVVFPPPGTPGSSVSVEGDPLPVYEKEGLPDPGVGSKLPYVEADNPEGSRTLLNPRSGCPKLVVFMSSNPVLEQQIPHLVGWATHWAPPPERLELVAVTPEGLWDAVWVRSKGWDGVVLADDAEKTITRLFGVSSVPHVVLVDEDGMVVYRYGGFVTLRVWRRYVQLLLTYSCRGTGLVAQQSGPGPAGR